MALAEQGITFIKEKKFYEAFLKFEVFNIFFLIIRNVIKLLKVLEIKN